ncbi:hypothetical protein VTL71DRAFT_2719 [Oculimacula yallundae]|uniref:Zn(2)-C6 fungal-type domain-containing protein n=1 Tax=Oculimacula yallundae TaxID=86028 RepID=A0ABR4CAV1_9HELO
MSTLSFNVCQRCKRRKKKCDRALPSCVRCTRLRVPCNYNLPQSHGIPTPPESAINGTDEVRSEAVSSLTAQDRNSFPEILDPFNFTLQAVLQVPTSPNLDEQLTKQCWSIISRNGAEDGILSSCSTYFSFIHPWLPILSKDILFDQILSQRSMPKGDVTILMLMVHLLSQLHQPIEIEVGRSEQLYSTAKGLYGYWMSTGKPSIVLVQAGILLAVYEHTQALHDETYLTLGACARMGYILGLDRTLSHDFQPSPEEEHTAIRQRQVWWGIIILERISMLEYIDKNLPFAIPKLEYSGTLPSEDGSRRPISHGLKQYGDTSSPDVTELSVPTRIAQGAYLLGHVIDRVRASNPDSSSCGAAQIDVTLRSYAMDLLQPSDHGHLCWPFAICLSAILMLNAFEISVEPKPMEAHEKEMFQSRAVMGLKSALRMILQSTTSSSDAPDSEILKLPIWVIHRAQYAAVLSLDFGIVDDDIEWWMTYIQTVKSMLKVIAVRSKLAANYLAAISAAETRRNNLLACQSQAHR